MKIREVQTCPFDLHFRNPFRISRGIAAVAQHVLIRIISDGDLFGLGESCPFPIQYAPESQETVLAVIRNYLRGALIGKDPLDIEALGIAMEETIPGHPLAKAGVEMAIYDLAARACGLPVYKLIGGRYYERVPLGWSIGIRSTTDEVVNEALHYANLGFPAIKLKIGADQNVDLERLAAVRAAVGPLVKLRVDANQGYSSHEALPILRRMEKYDLEYIEQPVPRWDLDGMARLTAALDTPISADESVFSVQDAMTLIKHGAADVFNVEPAKVGINNSKRIAAMAEAAGLSCVVGAMLEGGVANAANLHFACSTRIVNHPCELIGPLFFHDDILEDAIFSVAPAGAYWSVPEGIGFGVGVSEKWTQALENSK